MGVSKLPLLQQRTDEFTSSGTWVCPADVVSAEFLIVGAGGGGGGASNSAATRNAIGGGGGGGAVKLITLPTTPGLSYTITVGAKGTGGTSSAGTNGGYTEVVLSGTTLMRSYGGKGGSGIDATNNPIWPAQTSDAACGGGAARSNSTAAAYTGGGGGGAGELNLGITSGLRAGSLNQIHQIGGEGGNGSGTDSNANYSYTSKGGQGLFGYGHGGSGSSVQSTLVTNAGLVATGYGAGMGDYCAVGTAQSTNGTNATIAGCGGGGALNNLTTNTPNGGNGADGLVRITYFA